jgi:hypothetical protein
MKKDPKVFDLVNRQNGNQTIKTERIGNEANSRSLDPVKNQYAVETQTSQESLRFQSESLNGVGVFK